MSHLQKLVKFGRKVINPVSSFEHAKFQISEWRYKVSSCKESLEFIKSLPPPLVIS
jgi:hypothetical protein